MILRGWGVLISDGLTDEQTFAIVESLSRLKSTTNTNSNKTIGIFAKKGPIYCSQYYCRQIMIGLLLTTGSWHIPPVSHSDYSRSSNSGGLFDFSVTPGSFYSLSYWQWQLLNVEYDLDLDLVLDLGAYLELDNRT